MTFLIIENDRKLKITFQKDKNKNTINHETFTLYKLALKFEHFITKKN